jgi:hypothetical protein
LEAKKEEMVMLKRLSIWGAALSLLCIAGCGAQGVDEAEVGQLTLPLYSIGSDGTAFGLAATFELTGPEPITVTRTTADGNFGTEDRIELNPRVGSYSLTISNWSLYRWDPDMTPAFAAVPDATLSSAATVSVEIVRDTTRFVSFAFNVPGTGTVVFARGALSIDFTVEEGYPTGAACTASTQCASLVCDAAGTCAAATCTDGVQNGDEESPDCGPSCMCGGGMGGLGSACDPAVNPPTCSLGLVCEASATGGGSCQWPSGGIEVPCDAAQQAECAPGAMCTVNSVTNLVTCTAATCSATQAQQCPSDAMCNLDATGGVVCTGGQPIDPNLSCVSINEISTNGAVGTPNAGTNEYVELYNSCAVDVALHGTRLLYRSAAGISNSTLHNLAAGTVIAGGGFLLYANMGFTDVPADGALTNGMALLGGGVALTYGTIIFDSVGYGTATNAFIEGSVAVAPLEGASISRIPNGADGNVNSVDFVASPRTPRAAN